MTLARATVIAEVATRLSATADRLHPFAEGELPAWRVVTDIPESVNRASIDGTINEHRLPIAAEGFVRDVDATAAAADALASPALAALFAPPVPYGLQHEGTEFEADPDAEGAAGVIRLRLSAHYFVNPAQPDVLLSN